MRWVALLLVAACGRADFDPRTDDASSGDGTALVDAVFATPHIVQTQDDDTGTASVVVPISPTNAGDLLVVGTGSWGSGMPVVGVTDDQNNNYVSANARATSTSGSSEVWYVISSIAGATSVTVTFAGATNPEAWFFELGGMDPTNPLDIFETVNDGTVSDPIAGPVVTTRTPHSFVISIELAPDSVGAVQSPFVELEIQDGDNAAYMITTAIGSYGAVWQDSNSGAFNSTTAAFKAAAL